MEPENETDVLISNYVKDSGPYVECWEYETVEGDCYTVCQDQDGESWVE